MHTYITKVTSNMPATRRARESIASDSTFLALLENRCREKNKNIRIQFSRDFSYKKNDNELLIFDVSDSILDAPKYWSIAAKLKFKLVNVPKIKRFLKTCDAIVVASESQKERFLHLNKSIHVIPDLSFYHFYFDEEMVLRRSPVVFGWDGQGQSFQPIFNFLENNKEFFRNANVEVHIVTDEFYKSTNLREKLSGLKINSVFKEWDERSFIQNVSRFDIGLAIVNTKCPNSKLKPANKLINYFGLGQAVLASDIPSYRNFKVREPHFLSLLTDDTSEYTQLEFLLHNVSRIRKNSKTIHMCIRNEFDAQANRKCWNSVLETVF